jgi:hypothetical protein
MGGYTIDFARFVAITKFVALWMATQLILQNFVVITKFVALCIATQLIVQDFNLFNYCFFFSFNVDILN